MIYKGMSVYPDRESNPELSFRRALLYPFNYQGSISVFQHLLWKSGCKDNKKK